MAAPNLFKLWGSAMIGQSGAMSSNTARNLSLPLILFVVLWGTLGCVEPQVAPPDPAPEDELPVDSADVVAITVSPLEAGLLVGERLGLEVSATRDDGSSQVLTEGVTWSNSAPHVATLSEEGGVTGVAPGETVVEAAIGELKASARISVTDRTISSIEVTPSSLTLETGVPLAAALVVTVTYSDGTLEDVSHQVTWHSGEVERLAVLPAGELLGLAAGQVTLLGSFLELPLEVDVHLTGTPLSSIHFSEERVRLRPVEGDEATFRVEGHFGSRVADVTSIATYSVDAAELSVPEPGTLRVASVPSQKISETVLTASLKGLSDTAQVRTAPRRLIVADLGRRAITSFSIDPVESGNVAPLQQLVGAYTGVSYPHGVFFDFTHDELWIADVDAMSIATFDGSPTNNGDVSPLRRVLTVGERTVDVAYDAKRELLYAASSIGAVVRVYERPRDDVSGAPAVKRTFVFSSAPLDLTLDANADRLFVTHYGEQTLSAFDDVSTGEKPPRHFTVPGDRRVAATAIDAGRQRLYAVTHGGQLVAFADADTADDVDPAAIVSITGEEDRTFLGVAYDPETDSIYVSGLEDGLGTLWAFENASTFAGELEVAPSSLWQGPATLLRNPRGLTIGW